LSKCWPGAGTAPGYGASDTQVNGPTGSTVSASTPPRTAVGAVAEEVGSDRRADESDQEEQRDPDRAGDRELVAPEADPDPLPVAARTNRLGASPSAPWRLGCDRRGEACAG
jgi:hypothetical protein